MPNEDISKLSNQDKSKAAVSHTVNVTSVSSTTNNVVSPSKARTRVLLQSVRVKVHDVGGVVDVTFFYTKSNRSYAIWCIRWVRNGLMHSRCLMLLLGLVCLVSVHYAKFAMLYCKVQKVLATRCIARTFPWYVRHFIVLTCLPT